MQGSIAAEQERGTALIKTFILEGVDPESTDDSQGHRRVVCLIRGGGKLAIWGEDRDTRNIDKVRGVVADHGWPVVVRCDVRPPAEHERSQYGHTYWARQTARLEAIPGKK